VDQYLVGLAELADMLGVSKQRAGQLAADYEDFPAVEADLKSGPIWLRENIVMWMKRHPERSPGRPRKK
jgi:hypothetical protein